VWLLSPLFHLSSLDSVSLIIVFIIRRHHIAIDTTLRSTSYPTTPFQVDRGLFLLLSDCLPSRACTISFLVSSVNAGLLLHFHCHLYHILAPSRFEDLSILSEGNVGPTHIHQHLTKTSVQLHSCRYCAFPVRHHLTLFRHPRERGHRLLSACPGPSISEPDFFLFDHYLHGNGACCQLCLIHLDTCILLSAFSVLRPYLSLIPYTNCADYGHIL
jgi:hypothetical protein